MLVTGPPRTLEGQTVKYSTNVADAYGVSPSVFGRKTRLDESRLDDFGNPNSRGFHGGQSFDGGILSRSTISAARLTLGRKDRQLSQYGSFMSTLEGDASRERTPKDLVQAYEKKKGFSEHLPIRSLIDGYNRSLLKGRTEEDGSNIPPKRERSPGLNPVKKSEVRRQ